MKTRLNRKQLISLLGLTFLLLALPLTLKLVQTVQNYLSEAQGVGANIAVETKVVLGTLEKPWQALAQGGEEQKNMLNPVVGEIGGIEPRYIRIDHIYDFYHIISKNEAGKLVFNWERLDDVVNDILKTGATPFFSLSYMPAVIAKDGNITNQPINWGEWSSVVRATIQHFSGQKSRNLKNVIYEVWNEPDLFGNWKIGRGKNYCLLYQYAVIGANQVENTNPFKIGGPATTTPYQTWVDKFLDYIKDNRLRIDFYSWHRYALDPEEFLKDVNRVDSWLFKNAGYSLDKYITEWGSVSENSVLHDSRFDAAHLVAVARHLIQRIDLAFIFEIKDGPDPSGKKYWGRWGLLTHEKAGPVEKKPKYYALRLLNKMRGERIRLTGEGTWVTGFAAKESNKIRVILVNLDLDGHHFEKVPLDINSLENGTYSYKESFLVGAGKESVETITDQSFKTEIDLLPNNIVLIELSKS